MSHRALLVHRSVCGFLATLLLAPPLSALSSPPVRVAATEGEHTKTDDHAYSRSPDGLLAMAFRLHGVSRYTIEVATSSDLGRTWSPAVTMGDAYYPPVVSATGGGRIDVAWSAQDEWVHRRSIDGGLTWSDPDAPWGAYGLGDLAVNGNGWIALLTTSAALGAKISLSGDGGGTWAAQSLAPPLTTVSFSSPSVAWTAAGELLACWLESDPSGGRAICRRSADAGLSFDPPLRVIEVAAPRWHGSPRMRARAGSDVLLAMSVQTAGGDLETRVLRSTDGGASWSPPVTLATGFSGLSLEATAGEDAWLAAYDGYSSISADVYRSTDGINWSSVIFPAEASSCIGIVPSLVPAAGGAVLTDATTSLTWRTADQGATWDAGLTMQPLEASVQDAVLVATSSGRLVALWSEGRSRMALRSSFSDDGGATWSPATTFSDLPVSLRSGGSKWEAGTPPQIAATARAGGGLTVAWLALGPGGCAEVRASRSGDGQSFDPSVAVGPEGGFQLGIAQDGAGRLALSWPAGVRPVGGDFLAARSLDGGLTWSPPAPVDTTSTADYLLPSGIVRAADGSLVATAVAGLFNPGISEITSYRSTDGGLTWAAQSVRPHAGESPNNNDLFVAGPRLVSVQHDRSCRYGQCSYPEWAFDSTDAGVNWVERSDGIANGVIAAGASGDLYLEALTWGGDSILVQRRAGGTVPLGQPPASTTGRSAVELAPYELGLLYADMDEPSGPGVFYQRFAPLVLYRDDSIRNLQPPPDLSLVFPLPVFLDSGVHPGMLAPDDASDATHPLVLYQVDDGFGNGLRLIRQGPSITLDW